MSYAQKRPHMIRCNLNHQSILRNDLDKNTLQIYRQTQPDHEVLIINPRKLIQCLYVNHNFMQYLLIARIFCEVFKRSDVFFWSSTWGHSRTPNTLPHTCPIFQQASNFYFVFDSCIFTIAKYSQICRQNYSFLLIQQQLYSDATKVV